MPPELELVRQWLTKARSDLRVAEGCLHLSPPETASVCFHCQQAIEKAIKAYLVYHKIEFGWSHLLGYLLELSAQQDHRFRDFIQLAAPLTEYAVDHRYPSNHPDPTAQTARDALKVAKRTLAIRARTIAQLYAPLRAAALWLWDNAP